MKKLFFIFGIILLINFIKKYSEKRLLGKEMTKLEGVYIINSLLNNNYFSFEKNKLKLSKIQSNFKIIEAKPNIYCIESINYKDRIGVDEKNEIFIMNKNEIDNINKIYWNLIKINENQYLIKNIFNNKYIMAENNILQCSDMNQKKKNFIFNLLKLYEEGLIKKKYLKIIEKEPIDVLIKYIDLSDNSLNREGIIQICKDQDNEELRYSMRSIFQNIPWIRKVYILMPNEKVKYFKPRRQIKEKIIYIKDKDLLGYDSANIHAFTFNLFKMKKFGISTNFIYMEDDFFIGKPLKKSDFFYYDEEKKKVLPYLLTNYFCKMDSKSVISKYNKMLKNINNFHPHSGKGWNFSILSTNKYFIERYNITIINTDFTHNAIAENIDDLKEIFEEIKNYKYINETLFSKERHILTLNQPQFYNLYQLNIKHKKVHSIPSKYIKMENINKSNLNISLFVINTGAITPSINQYKVQKFIMEKTFPIPTQYELNSNKISGNCFLIYFLSFIFIFIKIIFLII